MRAFKGTLQKTLPTGLIDQAAAARLVRLPVLVWRCALISLPLDLLWFEFSAPRPLETSAFHLISLALLGIVLLTSRQSLAISLIVSLKKFRERATHWQRLFVAVMLLGVLVAGLAKLFESIFTQTSLLKVLVVLAVYGTAIWSMFHKFAGVRDLPAPGTAALTLSDLERLAFARIAGARVLSMWAAFTAASGTSSIYFYGAAAAASLVFLLNAFPTAADFVSSCRRCSQTVLRGTLKAGYCSNCHPGVFHTSAEAATRHSTTGRRSTISAAVQKIEALAVRFSELLQKMERLHRLKPPTLLQRLRERRAHARAQSAAGGRQVQTPGTFDN